MDPLVALNVLLAVTCVTIAISVTSACVNHVPPIATAPHPIKTSVLHVEMDTSLRRDLTALMTVIVQLVLIWLPMVMVVMTVWLAALDHTVLIPTVKIVLHVVMVIL